MKKGQILLVEDEQIVALGLQELLSDMGYEVVAVAASAEDALQAASDLHPDIVLMDIMLKGRMDGIEAARQIRANLGIPVIYSTAYADEATLSRAKLTQPYGYVVKPFEESSLQATIDMALSLSQTERRLRKSEQRYKQLLESAPAGIFEFNMEQGRIISANNVMCQYTGYSREEFLAIVPTDLIVGSSKERFLERQAKVLAGGQVPETVEYEIQSKDGTSSWISLTTRPRKAKDGSTVVTAVAHDLTERKEMENDLRQYQGRLEELVEERTTDLAAANARLRDEIREKERTEQQLRFSEAKYEQLVNMAQAGIYEIDLAQDQFVTVNDFLCAYTGYSRQDLLDMSPLQILAPESQRQLMARQQTVASGGKVPDHVEYTIVRKNGERFWASLSTKIVYEPGKPPHAIVVAHDVTQRVRAERRLRAALEEKEVLLQEVHHRVKNNLQMVSSLLDMQSMSVRDDDLQSMLQDSRNRVKAMALVHETLYQSADLAHVNIADYLRSVVGNLVGIYRHGALPLNIDFQVQDVVLDLDTAITCGLIVNELVSNALKYAFPPSRQVPESGEHQDAIIVHLGQQDSELLVLSIGDNGGGLPPDVDLEHAHSLGLRLIDLLTQQLQGRIELDRSDGTAFQITFPRNPEAASAGD